MAYLGGNPTTVFGKLYKSDNLPPRTVSKKIKESEDWQISMLDAFEYEAIEQFKDNLQFVDLYRMVEGKISYQELSEVAPHTKDIQALLDGVGIPSFLRHYDIIGIIVNALVGYYSSMQPKFHITDTGEVAENEYLRYKNKEAEDMMKTIIKTTVDLYLAESGFAEGGKQFNSQEEQQQYIAQLQQAIEKFTPKDTKRDSKKPFKTLGVQWGEATIDRDKELFNFSKLEREELKDYLIAGRCFRHYKIGFDNYKPETWSPKNTFFSREIEADMVHKGEYGGRLMFFTPAEVIERYGHEINTKTQKELLGGNESWKSFVGDGYYAGPIEQAIESNFNKQVRVPFSNYFDYAWMLGFQDETGIPMGVQSVFNKADGTTTQRERFLPKLAGDTHGRYSLFAKLMRDDYKQRLDLCQVTEVYFRAYDLWGYLTYEDETGRIHTEEVTEDILPQFLKDNNIKQTFTSSISDIIDEFKVNTIQWIFRPVVYEGVKIQSENLTKPLYLYCRPCEHQIQGDTPFEKWLPIGGKIGKSVAKKLEPYQAKYNLCMNQIFSLLEKEIGVFFLLDTALIPSEYADWGDAQEALLALRNVAKNVGIMPVTTSADGQRSPTTFNQFSTHNISFSTQIADRIRLAEFNQQKAYELVGVNPNVLQAPTKYETAEGIKQNQEATYSQISDIFEGFEEHVRASYELHLSVAHYCQSNKKDISIHYTKGDGSTVFLKLSDPEFPLRRIGIMPSNDRKKRKELEIYKQYLMGTNTLATDTLEVAKLISSDAMSEAIEIAMAAKERREQESQLEFERQQQLISQKSEADRNAMLEKWQLEEETNQRDRETDLEQERIKALGRASDKDSDTEGFNQINKQTDLAIKKNTLDFKVDSTVKEFQRKEKKDALDHKAKMEKLKLDAKKLEQRQREQQSKEYIAEINKN